VELEEAVAVVRVVEELQVQVLLVVREQLVRVIVVDRVQWDLFQMKALTLAVEVEVLVRQVLTPQALPQLWLVMVVMR
jgi:hypothetical protein